MAEHLEPDRLDLVLASVGRHLVVEPAIIELAIIVPADDDTADDDTADDDTADNDIADDDTADDDTADDDIADDDIADDDTAGRGVPVGTPSWRRRVLVAAALVLAACTAVASIAPARRAVSGWLRAGNIDVEIDPDLTVSADLPAFVDDVEPLRPSEVAGELGVAVPPVSRTALGPPDAWWAPLEGGILATWNEDETALWIVPTADTRAATLDKWLREPDAATPVDDLGAGGYTVEGVHIFQTPFRVVAANSVVAWSDGDLTFRLDSTMPLDRLVEVARTLTMA